MINLKVNVKTLVDNPDYDRMGHTTPTIPAKIEKQRKGIIQSYTTSFVWTRGASGPTPTPVAIVLFDNKLEEVELKDIIVLTDEE